MLGYWVPCNIAGIPSGFAVEEVVEWNPREPNKNINKKLYLYYEGSYYRKLEFEDSYTVSDKLVLVN